MYVELQRHREREEEWRNQAAIRIARSLRLPVIATNGVRYATEYDREIQDLFTAIRHHVELDQAGRLLAVNNLRYLRTAREMAALFRDVPGAVENTVDLSSRLGFELDDLGYEFPRYPVPEGETMDSFLRKRVAEGVERRYGPKNDRGLMERAKKQVEHELTLIAKLGFAGYFLIVWDIIRFCKQNDILVQGRGSAANSAVCYCARNHRHRSGRDGAALRAVSVGEPQRMAGHRPRSSFGRKARAGDSVRVPAIWRAWRRDDRQRHHLSRQIRRP